MKGVILVLLVWCIGFPFGYWIGGLLSEESSWERECVEGNILLTNGSSSVWKYMDDGSRIPCDPNDPRGY